MFHLLVFVLLGKIKMGKYYLKISLKMQLISKGDSVICTKQITSGITSVEFTSTLFLVLVFYIFLKMGYCH